MAKAAFGKIVFKAGLALSVLAPLAGCDENGKISFLKPKNGAVSTQEEAAGATSAPSTNTIERDVEAPDVFHVNEKGLWDGRPSLGGVWVAHPTVKDPERVIIRNPENGKSVIGALFRREIDNPGPKLQVSSDAAAALGILAGQPTKLDVVALRREEVPIAQPAEAPPTDTDIAPDQIEETTLDDPIASAAAAIDDAQGKPATPAPKPAAKPDPTMAAQAASNLPVSSLKKPFIQIGIFSIEANANKTAASLRKAGVVPIVKKQSSKGKTFWRVLVGPAASKSERAALLKKVKGVGYSDAYAVTN